ncbi:hypothetical protein V492_00644 [Pseudogymnoascus sp. VKM F-4246]|nr:hypothetical protein V492_00644 [Pseudogymnoascus sp. VKM F-4246]
MRSFRPLQEAERLREEEQRLRVEEQRLREEDRQRYERRTGKTTLPEFLDACHTHLCLGLTIQPDTTQSTQGDAANADNKSRPERILPWPEFDAEIPVLRDRFGLKGSVKFENHSNTLSPDRTTEQMQSLSISNNPRRSERLRAHANKPGRPDSSKPSKSTTKSSRPRADQFCVYNVGGEGETGHRVTALTIEYKAPHKLTLRHIYEGLVEMKVDEVVEVDDDESVAVRCRRSVAAVITQGFSYMVKAGVEYGEIYTGEATIFFHIPDDPSAVYYSLSVPKGDVGASTGAQWIRKALHQLKTWNVVVKEVEDAVADDEVPSSEYRPSPRVAQDIIRSPIQFRPRRKNIHVKLPGFGYTVAAKCTGIECVKDLMHESTIYRRLLPVQGKYVPVHLGDAKVYSILYYAGAVRIVYMMFLSFGGFQLRSPIPRTLADDAICARNILVHPDRLGITWIDFERAEFVRPLAVLGILSPNRKRKLGRSHEEGKCQNGKSSKKTPASEIGQAKTELARLVTQITRVRREKPPLIPLSTPIPDVNNAARSGGYLPGGAVILDARLGQTRRARR